MDEPELVDVIADACAVSTRNGLIEVAGLAISLRRRVIAIERRLDKPHVRVAARSMSFATNAEYRSWIASNSKPRYRRQAGSRLL